MHDDMRVERDIMVPMRDGIKLACDVYRPAVAGQIVPGAFPVLLERTPYGKGQTSRSEISRHHPERPTSRQEVAACPTWLCRGLSRLSSAMALKALLRNTSARLRTAYTE
jgi:predicted acyl esterase